MQRLVDDLRLQNAQHVSANTNLKQQLLTKDRVIKELSIKQQQPQPQLMTQETPDSQILSSNNQKLSNQIIILNKTVESLQDDIESRDDKISRLELIEDEYKILVSEFNVIKNENETLNQDLGGKITRIEDLNNELLNYVLFLNNVNVKIVYSHSKNNY